MRIINSLLAAAACALALPAAAAPQTPRPDSIQRQMALEFLYQSMTLPDSLDYSRQFYEANVDAALRARQEMPWGMSVPPREWLHFVLPVRVNNENLDSSRMVFYRELAPRVKGLSMTDAALEVNHWLHEKATYRPSDARTSSPLATVKTSWGRCGEESTLGVAAMRAVGIPARQVYTPRWAHTDDNHAWVEVWTDGRWHFLGACEPESILDLAWFNAPAARGMMMNTTVASGAYDGPEEVLVRTDKSTTINVTENYAPTGVALVTVTDAAGQPVSGAKVRFSLYNYGEFFPIARRTTDASGQASITAGLGDMLAWATDGANWGAAKVTTGSPATVVLDGTIPEDLDMVPPVQSGSLPTPTAEQAAANALRLAYEDSVRNAYMSTMATLEQGEALAKELGLDPAVLGPMMRDSYGNHATLEAFLRGAKDASHALALLQTLSAKDLRDVTPEVLADHYACATDDEDVLSPRVASELLTPWRTLGTRVFGQAQADAFRQQPATWVAWVRENIAVDDAANPGRLVITPATVMERRRDVDRRSRDIAFVAVGRSMGIPARIESVTGKPQWRDAQGQWHDAAFETAVPAATTATARTGQVVLDYAQGESHVAAPSYYSHFTISRIGEDGQPQLLEFDEDGVTAQSTFGGDGYPLDAGEYLLVTGQRMANGTVLAHSQPFTVTEGQTVHVPMTLRSDTSAPEVLGNFNAELLYHDAATDTDKSLISTTGRGYYVLGMVKPNHEPSAHAINDLGALASWPGKVMVIAPGAEELAGFRAELLEKLPANAVLGYDVDGAIAEALKPHAGDGQLPIWIIADTFNRVVWRSNGYDISLGRKMLETMSKL